MNMYSYTHSFMLLSSISGHTQSKSWLYIPVEPYGTDSKTGYWCSEAATRVLFVLFSASPIINSMQVTQSCGWCCQVSSSLENLWRRISMWAAIWWWREQSYQFYKAIRPCFSTGLFHGHFSLPVNWMEQWIYQPKFWKNSIYRGRTPPMPFINRRIYSRVPYTLGLMDTLAFRCGIPSLHQAEGSCKQKDAWK